MKQQPLELERAGVFVDDIFLFSSGEEGEQMRDLNERLDKLYTWSNDWGVDFNVSKTKHMRFIKSQKKEKRKGKRKRQKLFQSSQIKPKLGGEIPETVTEYKYLGILFTQSLKFDRHVLELILPRVKKISGQIRHLLSKIQKGDVLFFDCFG